MVNEWGTGSICPLLNTSLQITIQFSETTADDIESILIWLRFLTLIITTYLKMH